MPSTIPIVICVRGEAIYKHARRGRPVGTASIVAGYRYTAVLADKSKVILRGKTTRRYMWAYQWYLPVAAGKRAPGLAAYFTYSTYRVQPLRAIAELRIEWSSSTPGALDPLRALVPQMRHLSPQRSLSGPGVPDTPSARLNW
jgi:hypothetical protein